MKAIPSYTGQNQSAQIVVPRTTLYRQDAEESCWAMPPYALIFPPPPPAIPGPIIVMYRPPLYKLPPWA